MRIKLCIGSFVSSPAGKAACKLSVIWLLGILTGAYIASGAWSSFSPYLRIASVERTTILGVMAVLIVPILLTLCLEKLFSENAVLLTVFLKALQFSLISLSSVRCWGSAGWLVSGILMFSDFLSIPVLLRFWYRILMQLSGKREMLLYLLLLFAIGFIDYAAISPFLCSLF